VCISRTPERARAPAAVTLRGGGRYSRRGERSSQDISRYWIEARGGSESGACVEPPEKHAARYVLYWNKSTQFACFTDAKVQILTYAMEPPEKDESRESRV
jgi:hypothetical protein